VSSRRSNTGFEPLDGLVGRLLKNRKGLDQGGRVGRLRADWPTVVGRAVADHTAPGYLTGAFLTLYVDEAAWLTELNFQRPALVTRINEWAGDAWLRDLRLVQHALPAAEPPAAVRPAPPAVDPKVRDRARQAVAGIEDDALRDVIARALAAGSRRPRND